LTSALMSVYTVMGNNDESTYSRFLSLEAPGANDEDYFTSTAASVNAYNISSAYANLLNCWTNMYAGIERANLLLENIDKAEAPQATKDVIRGEALFLRAYYHFLLVSYWGDVPLKLSSTKKVTDVSNVRTPRKEVYAQVVQDMTTAEALVKPITAWNNTGRVSRTAIQGMLARVCLHAAGRLRDASYYTQALSWSQKVISSGVHQLNPDYKQIFINESADLYDIKEVLWEVEFYSNSGTSYTEYERFGSTIGINNTNNTAFMQAAYHSTGNHYALYPAGDSRRDWNMSNFYFPGNNALNAPVYFPATYTWGRPVAKWRRQYQTPLVQSVKNFGGTNWPLLRYADVLLMHAEADNEINGPTAASIAMVNSVKRRAFNSVKTITITNGGTGYTTAPTITVNSTSGTGTVATATVTAGVVTAITIVYRGSGYTSAPTITFTGGG
ncbi:MAG: RagB/SusD family nutrient uptake outer membrane protein, partial [Sphingobacteriales bacterium]